MQFNTKKLVFLGPPGAGKGTQAERVCRSLNIPHISTGDMLRAEIAACTDDGKIAHELISRGELVPDDMIVAIVSRRISKADAKNGYLLDGFPRTIAQAEKLDGITDIDYAVDIDVPTSVIIERLSDRLVCPGCKSSYSGADCESNICKKCGHTLTVRVDDNPDAIKKRIVVYESETLPIIEYYESRGKLVKIDGMKTRESVFESIMTALEGGAK